MDHANLFLTPTTYRLMRLEYGVGLAIALTLFIIHLGDVRWLPAIGLFAYSDAIGYIPGAIAYRRSSDGRISKVYYFLYNTMHSIVTACVVAGLWALIVKPEWALLAIPIHVCGDRSLFGNLVKGFSVHFEPKSHPVYARVRGLLHVEHWDVEEAAVSSALSDLPAPSQVSYTAAAVES